LTTECARGQFTLDSKISMFINVCVFCLTLVNTIIYIVFLLVLKYFLMWFVVLTFWRGVFSCRSVTDSTIEWASKQIKC